MQRTTIWLMAAMISITLAGCAKRAPSKSIHVGMPLKETRQIMAEAGAEEGTFFAMKLDVPPEGPEPTIADFLLPDGAGVSVIAEPTGKSDALLVKHITVCDNVSVPKLHQEWRKVETFTP